MKCSHSVPNAESHHLMHNVLKKKILNIPIHDCPIVYVFSKMLWMYWILCSNSYFAWILMDLIERRLPQFCFSFEGKV
jgi:hypothetical protein